MTFDYPYLLFLLIIPAALIALYIFRELSGRIPSFRVPVSSPWIRNKSVFYPIVRHIPFSLRIIAIILTIIAIARPRSTSQLETSNTEGIDIVLATDISSSMLAMDFHPTRLNASKDIAIEFIAQRESDRIGITVFAGESYIQCPLTTDKISLINLIKEIDVGLIDDGTAIGNGLATAISSMEQSDAASKVIILLTDGVDNCSDVAPHDAAKLAKELGIRVYTIGVGAKGTAPYPVITPWGTEYQQMEVEIDEDLLKAIASDTGGKYFRADDNTKLAEIYSEINKMEKTKTTTDSFSIFKEFFPIFALAALGCLLLELFISLFLRRLP